MPIRRAINNALDQILTRDKDALLIGEDIGAYGGCFQVTHGLLRKYGAERVIDTPISEGGIAGLSIGLALAGYHPILEIMFMDFTTQILDQILNQALKISTMYGDSIKIPLVIRTPAGGYRAYGSTHSQSLENIFASCHNLTIIYPWNIHDYYYGLLYASQLTTPVLFIENKNLYFKIDEFDTEKKSHVIEPKIISTGKKNLVISFGGMTELSLNVAKETNHTVLDVPMIKPMSMKLICEQAKLHDKIIVLQESFSYASIAEHIATGIYKNCLKDLKEPVEIIGAKETPIPFNPEKERCVLPNHEQLKKAMI